MHAKAHFSHSPVGHCADRIRWSWRQAKKGATDQKEPSTARKEEVTYACTIVNGSRRKAYVRKEKAYGQEARRQASSSIRSEEGC